MIVNNMNVFGERQHVEKFIPMTIKKILLGKKVLIHSDKKKKSPGSRFYIHARNVCSSLLFLLKKGKIGEKYHVIGEKEINNFELASLIAKILGKKLNYKMVDFHSTRPGHDLRYALKDTNLKALGWKQPKNFETSLQKTIKWTLKKEVGQSLKVIKYKLFKIYKPKNIGREIEKVYKSGVITEGKYSELFEKKFAKFINNKNCVLVNSGTSALTLAYRLIGIKKGDEVIVTPLVWQQTNH